MAPAIGIVLVKKFTYRGDPEEEWSNKYWLTGTPPATSADWRLLFDQVVNIEHPCYAATSKVVAGIAYNDNTENAHAVWTVDLEALGQTVPGTLTDAAGVPKMAGDQAGVVEWRTNRKNSRGKWIYLRKYMHDGFVGLPNADNLSGGTAAAYQQLANELLQGFGSGGWKIRSQRQDEDLATGSHLPYVTTRTLHRRGKRP